MACVNAAEAERSEQRERDRRSHLPPYRPRLETIDDSTKAQVFTATQCTIERADYGTGEPEDDDLISISLYDLHSDGETAIHCLGVDYCPHRGLQYVEFCDQGCGRWPAQITSVSLERDRLMIVYAPGAFVPTTRISYSAEADIFGYECPQEEIGATVVELQISVEHIAELSRLFA
jgi:hypothetical protein